MRGGKRGKMNFNKSNKFEESDDLFNQALTQKTDKTLSDTSNRYNKNTKNANNSSQYNKTKSGHTNRNESDQNYQHYQHDSYYNNQHYENADYYNNSITTETSSSHTEQPQFYRNKGNPFSKDTHKNQQYKKKEYNRRQNNTQLQQPTTATPVHNIDANYNREYKRIQGKLLDIEIRQEDEENKDQNDEMRRMIINKLNQNYEKITTDLDENTRVIQSDVSSRNLLQEILIKNPKILNNSDTLTAIIDIIISKKNEDEIQQDFIDLLGYDELDMISEFIQNRDEIKELIKAVKACIDDSGGTQGTHINVEVIETKSKKKKIQEMQKSQLTNLKVLQQLGFDQKFIKENEMLGLHEKKLSEGPINTDKFFSGVSRNFKSGSTKTEYLTNSVRQKNHVEIKVKPLNKERNPTTRVKTEELPEWAQKCFKFEYFNEIQSSVFSKAIKTDENLLICAPTGSGKTNIALLTIIREMQKQLNTATNVNSDFSKIKWNFKIVYLVPLKALANEIVDKFQTSLSFLNLKVNEFSADVNLSKEQIDQTNIFVAIPEKWDLFTRKNDEIFSSLKLMIIDEVHLLNEDRGRVIECIVARTIRKMELNQKFIRIVGLSATLPNYWDVAEFLRVKDGLFYFDSSYRTTPLKMKLMGVYERRTEEEHRDFENQIAFEEIVKYIDKGKQVLIFVHSRNETVNFAKDIIRRAQHSGRSDILQPGSSNSRYFSIKNKHTYFSNKVLDEITPMGIGFHNAGLMRRDRNTIETLFSNKTLNVLVSTSTLAWGVNLPAYAVIIKGVQYYDASKGTQVDMGILDIQQMFGRAGRPQFDNKGVAMIICPFKKVDHYVNLLKNQIDIESKLQKFLCDALNAEIAIGNILKLEDAISWLNLTYLSIRMRESKTGQPNNERLAALANEAFEILNKFKLIRYVSRSGTVHSTELGRIASKYYMSYQSIANFHENLHEDMYDEELLILFAKSEEFSSMKVYPEEKKELETLAAGLGMLTTSNLVDKKDASSIPKPMILLQTYLKGFYEFKSSSLHMDSAYIIDNSSRIMRAILEISLHKNLVRTTFLCLNYVKMVERRVYPGTTPLWQFTFESNRTKQTANHSNKIDIHSDGFISADICRKIDKLSTNYTLEDLIIEDRVILSKLLGTTTEKVYDAMEFAKVLPNLCMEVVLKPITRTILNVTINLRPKFKWKKKWNHLSEPFWIIVDDKKEIIHYEYYSLPMWGEKYNTNQKTDRNSTVITFAVPFAIDPGEVKARVDKIYTISFISDRWVGVEYTHHIFLNEIEVPNDQDVHTELMDLYPLPLTALNNPEFEKIFTFNHFNPVQTQVFYSCYHSDENILVGAPTGSGKTLIAELAILRVFRINPSGKIIYIAPLKSLAKERIRDWESRLKLLGKKVLELTGDFTPDLGLLLEADLLVTTPEKWDGISRNWHHRTYVQRVSLVIIDEIHLLGLERGPVLEVIVSRMRYIAEKTNSKVRFVGLSTALANSYDVATWLGISTSASNNKRPPGLFNFKPAVRPCPVTVHINGFSEKHYCPRMGTMNKPAYNAIKDFSYNKPVLIFVSSRRQTRLTALDLISMSANESSTHSFLKISSDEIRNILELVKDENLRHTLSFGIGMHHAGLTESDRRIVEDLFYNFSIQVLVATSTVAWGVNFPAHLVIIKGTEFYDAKLKTYVDMPITDILQMIGRAGRPQYDDSAVACLFVTQEKKNFYKKFLYEPFPLESTLHKMLHDHINAEISSGTLLSKPACIEYITWTYFFRRLLKNPSYYGLKSVEANTLNVYLDNLITGVLNDLADSKCITQHSDESLSSTLLGYLCSFYYISYKTGNYFEGRLSSGLMINNLIEILCNAEEFSQLPVRHNEEDLNEALAKLCPIEVDHLHLDSPHVKTNLLLQAHLGRIPLPISDYVTDTKLVLDNCMRILLLMIDISSEKGYLDTTINTIVLSQMIMQGLWLTDSSLLTLPHITNAYVSKIYSTLRISHLAELMHGNTNSKVLQQVGVSLKEIEEIRKVLDKIPQINMNYKCYTVHSNDNDRKIYPGNDMQIRVNLEKVNYQYDNYVVTSRYPKSKTCRWFLIVGNTNSNELLGIKKISFQKATKKTIDFICPDIIDDSSLQLYLMSDSYLGIDQQYPILLNSINQKINSSTNENNTIPSDLHNEDDLEVTEEIIYDNW